jgi:hypothetical protein
MYFYCYVYVFLLLCLCIFIVMFMYFYCYVYVFLLLCLCILILMYVLFCIFCFHCANWHSLATLTEVLTFICLRQSYISYELGSHTAHFVTSHNEQKITAIKCGAFNYSIVVNAHHVTIMADTDMNKKQKLSSVTHSIIVSF